MTIRSRLVYQRRDELRFLLHTFAQLTYLLLALGGEVEPLEPYPEPRVRGVLREPLERCQVQQRRLELLLLVEAALLGEVADPVLLLGVHRPAEHTDVSRVGPIDAHHHSDGGGLAGAVGAKQAEYLALFDVKSSRR